MPEAPRNPPLRQRRVPAAAAAFGMGLVLATGFGGIVALLAALLAQPALALAVRGWRVDLPAGRAALLRDARALLSLWSLGLLAVVVLVGWPLLELLRGNGLGVVLALSAMAGLCVLGLWRTWPLWHGLEREGGSVARHWQALARRDASGWHGAAAGACVAAILACILLLAWPQLLPGAARWALAATSALAWPLLHLLLQRMPVPSAAARPIPVVEMDGEATRLPSPVPEGDLDRALYAAARAGRVD